MKKKLLSLMLVLVLIGSTLTGCGKSGGEAGEEGGETSTGRKEVVVWNTYGSNYHGKMVEMANQFNASQEEYTVTVEQTTTVIQKMELLKQEDYPTVFTSRASYLGSLTEGTYVVPLQKFLDKDDDKWTDDIYESVRTTYSDLGGNMIGCPLGLSTRGFMVNTTILEKAGYTLEDITSFEKVTEIAQAAYDKGLCTYGYIWSDGIDIMDILTYQGVDLVDGGNGWDKKETKSLYNEGETYEALKKLLGLMAGMIESGAAAENIGEENGGKAPFVNGEALFWTCSNSYGYTLEGVSDFEWSFVPFVGVDENAKWKNCALSEGSAFFIADTGDEKEMQGGYEFIKFMAEKEQMISWSTTGGYIPYTNEAAQDATWAAWKEEYFPSLTNIEEVVKNTSVDFRLPNTRVMEQILNTNLNIFSNIIADPTADLDTYIKEAADSINSAIEMKNLRGQ